MKPYVCHHEPKKWWWCDLTGKIGGSERRRCWCGEDIPLGPSNDTPEAVRIEIRAAELAVTVTDPLWWSYYADRSDTGWLAHAIKDHDDERSDR